MTAGAQGSNKGDLDTVSEEETKKLDFAVVELPRSSALLSAHLKNPASRAANPQLNTSLT